MGATREIRPDVSRTPAAPTGTSLAVCLPVPPTAAQEFKAVFVQATDILGQFSGPRVVALDGNDASCADQYRSAAGA